MPSLIWTIQSINQSINLSLVLSFSLSRSLSLSLVLSFSRSLLLSFGRRVPHRGALLSPTIHHNASQDFLLKTASLPVSIGHNRFSNDFFEDFHFNFPAEKTQNRRFAVCKRVPENHGGFFKFIKNANFFYSRQLWRTKDLPYISLVSTILRKSI